MRQQTKVPSVSRLLIEEAAGVVHSLCPLRPRLALVLGSGFQSTIRSLEIAAEIPYSDLPGFPISTVSGHAGKLLVGWFGKVPLLILSGRSHYYEGHPMERITFPVRVLAELGLRHLLLTNAAGGINPHFHPGDFMVLEDHINFFPGNPLRGPPLPGLTRFVDMTRVYDPDLNRLLKQSAKVTRVVLHSGVYLGVPGPSYETPAEIRAFARLGADAVGMSTIPEAIVARQCGLAVAGLSCITNLAAGRNKKPLIHAEVLARGQESGLKASKLLGKFVELCAAERL